MVTPSENKLIIAASSFSSTEDLDWVPKLSPQQRLLCSAWTLAAAASVWHACRLLSTSMPLQCEVTAVAAVLVYSIVRSSILESQYQGKQRMEVDLADRDSHFHHIANLRLHVKSTCSPAVQATRHPAWAFHCYHGFGSNTYTWSLVQPKLSLAASALVTAHDMPGFGLTQRPQRLSQYCLAFNGRLGSMISERELAALTEHHPTTIHTKLDSATAHHALDRQCTRAGGNAQGTVGCVTSPRKAAGRRDSVAGQTKRVLIGHSIGSVCAALEAMAHPEQLHALVLVAPAIPAFPSPELQSVELRCKAGSKAPGAAAAAGAAGAAGCSGGAAGAAGRGGDAWRGRARGAGAGWAAGDGGAGTCCIADLPGCQVYVPAPSAASQQAQPKQVHKGSVAAVLMQVCVFSVLLWLVVLQPIFQLLVRSAVRTKAFWQHLLHQAHFDKSTVTPKLVDAYRMPQLVRRFEVGVIKFLIALPNSLNMAPWTALRGLLQGSWHEKLVASRLARQVARSGLPLLIIHGEHDKVIPLSNSMRLARTIPGSQLVVLQRCGHVPQEEHPDLFVAILQAFLGQRPLASHPLKQL